MSQHAALNTGNVAVITGGADGIGLAAARHFKSLGMVVCIADVDEQRLQHAATELDGALALVTDVANSDAVDALRDQVLAEYGRVDVLMNNAGIGLATSSWSDHDSWRKTLDVNLWGVINGVHSFLPTMIAQGTPAAVINTGSKQGITLPPGNPAYNVSKAGIKAVTECLAHDLRNTPDCRVSAHLLVPGFTYTGMIRRFVAEQPQGAWTPGQVVDYMVEAMAQGDFYILCPDNDTPPETDRKRMRWAMGDMLYNRPALSRWHADFSDEFEVFMQTKDDVQ